MRLEEIIPTEPKKKREYDHAVQCLEKAKKSGRRFIHISIVAGLVQRGYIAVHRGHIDAPSEYVYIWYNGVEIYIRADDMRQDVENPVEDTKPPSQINCDRSHEGN